MSPPREKRSSDNAVNQGRDRLLGVLGVVTPSLSAVDYPILSHHQPTFSEGKDNEGAWSQQQSARRKKSSTTSDSGCQCCCSARLGARFFFFLECQHFSHFMICFCQFSCFKMELRKGVDFEISEYF